MVEDLPAVFEHVILRRPQVSGTRRPPIILTFRVIIIAPHHNPAVSGQDLAHHLIQHAEVPVKLLVRLTSAGVHIDKHAGWTGGLSGCALTTLEKKGGGKSGDGKGESH